MYKLLGILLLLALVGCSTVATPVAPNPIVVPQPTPSESVAVMPGTSGLPVETTGVEPPRDKTWVSPGKVRVSGLYPGATAEYMVKVHNGSNEKGVFNIYYREPDYADTGYSKAPGEAASWVTLSNSSVVLEPFETRGVVVTLTQPANTTAPKSWVFWVGVKDAGQKGMVQTELCIKFLITMR